MFDTTRRGNGMFSTGNMNPLNMIVGRNKATNEMNIAVCCDSAPDEISKPRDNETSVNKMLSLASNTRLPLTGTPSTNTLSNKMLAILIADNNRYGMAFAITTINGFIGETSITSMVPISFSLTIVIAVIMVHTSSNTMAITPGTKL